MNKFGTGGGNNKLVSPTVRTGTGSKGSSPGAADQLGQSTAFRKDQVDAGRGYNPTKFGNELALNVGKGGPGTGRTVMPCGSQGQYGSPAPSEGRMQGSTVDRGPRAILGEKGSKV